MKLEILLFGQLTDLLKANSVMVDHAVDTNTLREGLIRQFPQLANTSYTIAVNKKTVTTNTKLTGNCTIALMPPFSGG